MNITIDSFFETAFKDFVGKFPQVYDAFHHYYGEERISPIIIISNTETGLKSINLNAEEYKKLFLEFEWKTAIDTCIVNKVGNNLVLSKLYNFIENIKTNSIEEHTEKIINDFIKMCTLILRQKYDKLGILTHFPKVTITNEHNNSVDIFDMYALTSVNFNATMSSKQVKFCKSTYTKAQYNSRYIHSHIKALSVTEIKKFKYSCLGSGPLSRTIPALSLDVNLDLWPLFCFELDKYLEVESITGGPYIRMSAISNKKPTNIYHKFNSFISITDYPLLIDNHTRLIKGFIEYLINQKVLNIVFAIDSYKFGHSFKDISIIISNAFIDYFNNVFEQDIDNLISAEEIERYYFSKVLFDNNKITYVKDVNISDINNNNLLFMFKNNPVYLKIVEETPEDLNNSSMLLHFDILNSIVINFLNVINNATKYREIQLFAENTEQNTCSKKVIIV